MLSSLSLGRTSSATGTSESSCGSSAAAQPLKTHKERMQSARKSMKNGTQGHKVIGRHHFMQTQHPNQSTICSV